MRVRLLQVVCRGFRPPTCTCRLPQVLLWVLLSLLPLVEGAHMKAGAAAAAVGSDSGDPVALLGGQEEPDLPVTLPEVVEDEEQEDDGAAYSTWHPLYGTEAVRSVADTTEQAAERICCFM